MNSDYLNSKVSTATSIFRSKLINVLKTALQQFVNVNTNKMVDILKEQNKKPTFESYLSEISGLKNDIQDAINSLEDWMKPDKPSKSLPYIMDQVRRIIY